MNPEPMQTTAPSREAALLLQCTRVTLALGDEERIRDLLREGIDWNALLPFAQRHGMVPLLYRHLRGLADLVPGKPLDTLRDTALSNAVHSMMLMVELREILRLFEANGIPALPYKGPVLALQLYGETALRQMSDLDVLVRREDAVRAIEVLLERGYRSPHSPSERQRRALFRSDKNYPPHGDGAHPPVEVHWGFAFRHPIRTLGLDELKLGGHVLHLPGGMQVPTFAPEDLLIVLCFHGGRHMWERLAWLCDIAQLIRTRPLDWDAVLTRAAHLSSRRVEGAE
jgi:hypothetical protein